MSDFIPDKAIEMALATWYAKSSPLHFDSRHPCIKLAGECGELLDLYAKNEYKPNFSWWNCKECNKPLDTHVENHCVNTIISLSTYTPLVLDELGDISYYLRILTYIRQLSFETLCREFSPKFWDFAGLDRLLALLNQESADILTHFMVTGKLDEHSITISHATNLFLAILHKLDCPLEKLLDLNYKKLNTENQHGWANATIK